MQSLEFFLNKLKAQSVKPKTNLTNSMLRLELNVFYVVTQ